MASQDPDCGLRVVKVMDYDSFDNILSDSNPNLFLPLGFAGGLRDRFTGLVRFCHRDYDPTVGRFTAPDPLGDTGGDHDPYDYCVDEPVGRIDPEGLQARPTSDQEGPLGAPDFQSDILGKLGIESAIFPMGKDDNEAGQQGGLFAHRKRDPLYPTYVPTRDGEDTPRPQNVMYAFGDGGEGQGAGQGATDQAGGSESQPAGGQSQPTPRDTRTPPPAEPVLDQMERQGRGLPEPEVDDGQPLSKAEKDYLRQHYPDTDLDKIKIRRRAPGMFGDASGVTTGNTLYMDPAVYPPDPKNDRQLKVLPEELAHAGQQRNNPGFYFKYAGEYVWDRIKGKSHDDAYNNISYEVEAKTKAKQVLQQMQQDRAAGRLPWPSAPSK